MVTRCRYQEATLKPWTFMLGVFQRRAGARLNITREADALIERDGDIAYSTAREFSRTFREADKRDLARYWGYVALNIANTQGIVVGQTAADRYEQDARR
jgi:hypothetical protein